MNERYEKIINISNYSSGKRKKMSLHDRAAQFAPYAALTGFDPIIREEARITDKKIELDDYEIERIDTNIRLAIENKDALVVRVTYFLEDKRKNGGAYLAKEGSAVRVDEINRLLILSDGAEIKIDDILDVSIL